MSAPARPGRPLPSGFDYRPVAEHPELAIPDEVQADFFAFLDDVAECQRHAARTAQEVRVQ